MDLQLQYRASTYWFDASDREDSFIARAVAFAAACHAVVSETC